MCTGNAIKLTSNSNITDRLFNKTPAYNLFAPMVNHNCCRCKGCCPHILENTNTDKTTLVNIAKVDNHPLALLVLPGRHAFIKKAISGMATAASA